MLFSLFQACNPSCNPIAHSDITRYNHRETFIAKLAEIQQNVEQLLAELQTGEKSVLVNEFPLELLKKELNNASYG